MAASPGSCLKVALAQIDIELGQVRANLDKAAHFIFRAAQEGANVIVLPELWATGYDLERSLIHAEVTRLEILPSLARLASEHRIHIVGSLLLADAEGRIFNSATLFDPQGRVSGRVQQSPSVRTYGGRPLPKRGKCCAHNWHAVVQCRTRNLL
jgi:predicted amidohydrolase